MIRYFSETGVHLCIAMPGDAGYDLPVSESTVIGRFPVRVPTGIYLEMSPDVYAAIVPRSSAATKHNLNVVTGTVDSGYRGEIKVVAYVIGWRSEADNVTIEAGDSISQLIFNNLIQTELSAVDAADELSKSSRGDGGFGSTYSEFFYDGKVWTGTPDGAIAKIKRRGLAYNWFVQGKSGFSNSMSEAVTECMRALGVSERYI